VGGEELTYRVHTLAEASGGVITLSSRTAQFVFEPLPARVEGIGGVCLPDTQREPPASQSSLLSSLRDRFSSDEELAERLRNGDADALTVLFKRHSGLVFGIARRILRDDAEAEDSVQQIFLDVFRSIQRFDAERGPFKNWLLMFAYHRTFNSRRSLVAARFFDSSPLEDAPLDALGLSAGRPGYSVAESGILIGQVLGSLPPRQRRTIELTYYEGLTAEEVSARTGESVRVVRHNLYRGLDQVRKTLSGPGAKNTVKGRAR
jgi:RNA polymerase sigma-70 factor, ECF subfamily